MKSIAKTFLQYYQRLDVQHNYFDPNKIIFRSMFS